MPGGRRPSNFVQVGRRRWRGEPLPLPPPTASDIRGSRSPQRLAALPRGLHQRVTERSLNALSRARVLCDSGAFFGTPSGAPSRTQRVVLVGLVDRITAYDDRPEVGSPDQALHDVVRIKDLHSREPSNLAAYSMDRLRVARGRIEPKPVEDLLPPGLTALVKEERARTRGRPPPGRVRAAVLGSPVAAVKAEATRTHRRAPGQQHDHLQEGGPVQGGDVLRLEDRPRKHSVDH